MKIEILGTGCPKCKKLMELTGKTVKDIGISADIIKVDKINDIIKYNVMLTPALVIDGEVKCTGRIPSGEEIKNWVKNGGE
jgi:small redox-active disulfide protein 2